MDFKIITEELNNLMWLIIMIPDVFKKYLVFESPEIENFDIGLKSFWLKIKIKEQEQKNSVFPDDEYFKTLRETYFVSKYKPVRENGFILKKINKVNICKPQNFIGEVFDDLSYSFLIKKSINNSSLRP